MDLDLYGGVYSDEEEDGMEIEEQPVQSVATRHREARPVEDDLDRVLRVIREQWATDGRDKCPLDLVTGENHGLAGNVLLKPYDTWLRGLPRNGREDAVLPLVLHQLGLMRKEAESRAEFLSLPSAQVGKAMLEEIEDDQRKILQDLMPQIHTAEKSYLTAPGRNCLEELKKLAQKVANVLDGVRIIYQAHAYVVEKSCGGSTGYYENDNKPSYLRDVLVTPEFVWDDESRKDVRAKIALHMLRHFKTLGYRKKRHSDFLYEEVTFRNDKGKTVRTYAYQPIEKTIEELVYGAVQKEYNHELWQSSVHGPVAKDIVDYLRKCHDVEVPHVREKPLMWSFRDGIYCAERDQFAYYEEVSQVFPEIFTGGYSTYKFMKDHDFAHAYFSDTTPPPPSSYWVRPTNMSAPPAADDPDSLGRLRKRLDQLELPNFLKILRDQQWSEPTIFLKLATLGRILWPGGSMDNCQYWPCDLGVGGSGKSTIQDIFKELLHWIDIGVVGADQESTFSRDKLADKRVILIPEMRGDRMGISMEFFLAIVARDSISLPVKYGEPRVIHNFSVQGIIATNELPKAYVMDLKGAVCRRLLVFPWPRAISPRDPTLKEKILQHELPLFLRAIALAYRELPKDVDIMSDYPLAPEMEDARARLQRSSNSLLDFLLSDDYVFRGPQHKVTMRELMQGYASFVKEVRNERPCPWNPDFYDYPFRLLKLSVLEEDTETYVSGCTLRREGMDESA